MDAGLRAALAAAVGARGATEHSVSPADATQVAAVLAACAEHGAGVVVASGPAPRTAAPGGAVVLSLAKLSAVEVRAGALVARAEGGATVAALSAAAAAAGLKLCASVITPAPAPTHVGSAIARGGLPRRALTGIEAVLTTGEVIRAGGPVQRDVAGYDLTAVLLGSAGRLAVITAAWFRLVPAAARVESHEAAGSATPGPLAASLVAAFDPSAVLGPPGSG